MLLSHTHRFIFMKTYKTGGTSIEFLLSRFMGEEDVITPTHTEDEVARFESGVYPRNYQRVVPTAEALATLPQLRTTKQVRAFLQQTEVISHFWEHMEAQEIRARVPRVVWDGYLKVTAERHPYEKVVSMAYYRSWRRGGKLPIGQYIDEVIARRCGRNYDIYAIEGKIIADLFIRYEQYETDVRALLTRLHLPADVEIPKVKTQQRLNRTPAADMLTPAQKAIIQEKCREEFEHFGYAR